MILKAERYGMDGWFLGIIYEDVHCASIHQVLLLIILFPFNYRTAAAIQIGSSPAVLFGGVHSTNMFVEMLYRGW